MWARAEVDFVETLRRAVAPLAPNIPAKVDGFIAWFEALKQTGPGQGDPLFPFLAETATFEQMKWFLRQEVAGEAGFDDLLAMTQLKMPGRAKLEMARNFWDEMGRGFAKGMHGPMLARFGGLFRVGAARRRCGSGILGAGQYHDRAGATSPLCFSLGGRIGRD